MFLNKLWFILVALAASVAMTVALVAPQSASRQLGEVEARGLDRAQYAAEQMLKTDARRWIDRVSNVGRDARITESLENASRDAGEERLLHETVLGRLGSLFADPASLGIVTLGAVDANGKVIARIGQGENQYGDSIAGLEVVADALRGYLTDSMAAPDGKLVRLAAAPVLAKTRDRVVGAIWVSVDAGARLADTWKKNLGMEIAFLLGGQVTHSTMGESALGSLAAEVESRREEIAAARRTRAFALPFGADSLLAVAAPFPGEAAALGGHYVLLEKLTAAASPLALLAATTKEDLAWGHFPWPGLAAVVAVMLVVGLLLQRREIDGPLARLRVELQKLSRGELRKLDDGRHPGRWGGLARDVNASLERAGGGEGPQSDTARKDLNKILGDSDRERVASLPPLPPLGGPAAAWGSGGKGGPAPGGFGASTTPGGSAFPQSISRFGAEQPGSPGGMPNLGMGSVPGAKLSSPPLGGAPPRPAMPGGLPPLPGPGLAGGAPLHASPGYAHEAQTPIAMPLPMAPPPPAPPPMVTPGPAGAKVARAMEDLPTQDMVNDQKTTAVDEWEGHVRAVFAEYIETRARGNESIAGLTLDKFRQKLDANRQAIIEKHRCRSARFTVYVKDGKAALKASPLA